jgi:glycosyltransferase involved in cell wall biosynthesis
MLKKVTIIHYQPLEKYPPVMNFINAIGEMDSVKSKVFTTFIKNAIWFSKKHTTIHRVSKQHTTTLGRYWGYLKFNFGSFFQLVVFRPTYIFIFETHSVFSAYFYKILEPKTKVHIHYHEYTSPQEIKKSSLYFKGLHALEKKLFCTCESMSHTNEDRVELFLKDYPFVKESKMIVAPNIPPSQWYEFSQVNKKEKTVGITRLVHVGALSLETMYVEKMVEWVIAQKGLFTLDFYTDNITDGARKYIEGLQSNLIQINDSINYFELSKVLIHYDIGLTLYNGHIPNHVYSVPNKVLEYLACGLGVWYPNELISTQKFVKEYRLSGCRGIDFQTKESINLNLTEDLKKYNTNENLVTLFKAPNELLILLK